jgi:hypothetical protein
MADPGGILERPACGGDAKLRVYLCPCKVGRLDHEDMLAIVEENGVVKHLGLVVLAGYASYIAGQFRSPVRHGAIRPPDDAAMRCRSSRRVRDPPRTRRQHYRRPPNGDIGTLLNQSHTVHAMLAKPPSALLSAEVTLSVPYRPSLVRTHRTGAVSIGIAIKSAR